MQSRIDNLFEQTFPCRGAQYNAILPILHLSCTRVNTHTHICTYSKLSRKTLSATTSVLCLCLKFSTHTFVRFYLCMYVCNYRISLARENFCSAAAVVFVAPRLRTFVCTLLQCGYRVARAPSCERTRFRRQHSYIEFSVAFFLSV